MAGLFGILLFAILPASASPSASDFAPGKQPERAVSFDEEPNELCRSAHLLSLEFSGVRGTSDHRDYCTVPALRWPPAVRQLVAPIVEVQSRIAAVLGVPTAALFASGHHLRFRAYVAGSIGSDSDEFGVGLTVAPDFSGEDFPHAIYAHELVHVLSHRPGPLAAKVAGFYFHPLLFESLPDLIAAFALGSPVLPLGESALPESIRNFRNGTPVRSFHEPFGRFSRFSDLYTLEAACAPLSISAEGTVVGEICARARQAEEKVEERRKALSEAGATSYGYAPGELARSFTPEHCLTRGANGLSVFDNCDPHALSNPLLSFFFRLKEKTGRSFLRPWIDALALVERSAPEFSCGYAEVLPGRSDRRVRLRKTALSRSFSILRQGMSENERVAFAMAWDESGLEKFTELERLYRTQAFPARAALAAARANDSFARERGCEGENIYVLDPVRCRVECREKTL